jgi:hypothetical protein
MLFDQARDASGDQALAAALREAGNPLNVVDLVELHGVIAFDHQCALVGQDRGGEGAKKQQG